MSADARSARLSLIFSSIGHTYSHLFQPLYYVAVLTLEKELGLTHGETVQLAVLGGMLFGFGAPIAGWLGDRMGAMEALETAVELDPTQRNRQLLTTAREGRR